MIFGLGATSPQVWAPSTLGSRFLCFQVRDKLYEHLVSHEIILKCIYALKDFWLKVWHIIIFQTKICLWAFETLCIWFKHIDAITNSTNMMFKENNGNAFIMKCYANYEFQYDV